MVSESPAISSAPLDDRWLRGMHGPLIAGERRPVYRVAGVRLRPLCLWHVRCFELLPCGELERWGELSAEDVWQILAVCRTKAGARRIRRIPWWCRRAVRKELERCKVELGVYLGEYLESPVALPASTRGKPGKVPWWLFYATGLRYYFGLTEAEAWGCPVGAAIVSVTACREVQRLAPAPAGGPANWLTRGEWVSAPDYVKERVG